MSSAAVPVAQRPQAQPAAEVLPQIHAPFRPDIEGLRGIAVLSVLAVHTFPQWVEGGFVGVDVFFVLSGFLISGIVLRSLQAGRFSYADFYARRARRIFPALSLVLLACLVAAVLFTYPAQARQIGKHVAGGASFVSNIVLWKEAGYFDASSESKPLLHLWSLGIEEQFYLVWPAAAVLLFKRPRWAVPLIVGSMLLSFAANVAFVASKPTASFFLPPARFWELMVGALLAYLCARPETEPVAWLSRRLDAWRWDEARVREAFACTGALLLALALGLIDKTQHFPGWWALLPAVGTFLLLAAGPSATINRRLLGQPVLRFYGAISYPLYLWHWPLLSFPVLMGIPLENDVRVLILIASVALAALTCELLEQPVRAAGRSRRLVPLLCAALAAIGVGGALLRQTDGLIAGYPPEMRAVAAAEFSFDYGDYRVGRCMLRLEQGPEAFAADCIDRRDSARPLVLLWGDSHAAALYPGLATLARSEPAGWRLAQYTAARCPPLPQAPPAASRECGRTNADVLARIAAERPDTVVLAGYWLLYGRRESELAAHLAGLRDSVEQLKRLGVRRVVVLGHLPTWTMPLPRVLLEHYARTHAVLHRAQAHRDPAAAAMDQAVEQAVADSGAVFVSPIARLCDASGCLAAVEGDGGLLQPVMADESHLTPQGSELLIRLGGDALLADLQSASTAARRFVASNPAR